MTVTEICTIINAGKFWGTSPETVNAILIAVAADFRGRAAAIGGHVTANKTEFERNLSTKQDLEIAADLVDGVATT